MSNTSDDLIGSYINFLNSTNVSIHSLLEIVNNQQSSFNNILSSHNYSNSERRRRQYTYPEFYTTPRVSRFNENLYNSYLRTQRITPRQETEFTNVIIRPSVDEIVNSTTRTLFCNIDNPLHYTCPISHIEFTSDSDVIQLNYCKHIFNPTHIMQWFQSSVYCPLCRHDIRIVNTENVDNAQTEYAVNNDNNNNDNNNDNDNDNDNENTENDNNQNDNTGNDNEHHDINSRNTLNENNLVRNQRRRFNTQTRYRDYRNLREQLLNHPLSNHRNYTNRNSSVVSQSRLPQYIGELVSEQINDNSDLTRNLTLELQFDPLLPRN